MRETTVHLDLEKLGLVAHADGATQFTVTDLLTEQVFTWGADNYVRLDAFTEPVHILRIDYPKGS